MGRKKATGSNESQKQSKWEIAFMATMFDRFYCLDTHINYEMFLKTLQPGSVTGDSLIQWKQIVFQAKTSTLHGHCSKVLYPLA